MDTKTKVILVIIAILVPGIFFQQFFNLGFMVDLQTYSYGTITMPTIIVGAIFFWGTLAIIYGIYELIKDGIEKIKTYIQQKSSIIAAFFLALFSIPS